MLLNVDGSLLQQGDSLPSGYFMQQMISPVLFDMCANHTAARDIDIWIELSAKTILIPLLRPSVPSGTRLLPTLGVMGANCWSSITKALAQLYTAHVPINWAQFHRPYPVNLIPLPSYPFSRNEHWVEYSDHLSPRQPVTKTSSLSEFIPTPLGLLQVKDPWKHYIIHHTGTRHQLQHSDLVWLIFSCTQSMHIINLEFYDDIAPDMFLEMTVQSCDTAESTLSFHCGHYDSHTSSEARLVARCQILNHEASRDNVKPPRGVSTYQSTSSYLSKHIILRLLRHGGLVENSTALESLAISHNGYEAVGRLEREEQEGAKGFHGFSNVSLTPVQMTSVFQAASILMALESGPTVVQYLPQRIDSLQLMSKPEGDQSLSAHLFLETRNGLPEVTQISVYSEDRLPILSMSGLHGPLTKHNSELHIEANTWHDSRQARNDVTPISPASVTVSPTSTQAEEKEVPTPELVPQPFKILDVKPEPPVTLSIAVDLISILAEELGVPKHTVRRGDLLEEVGVDSIMWLLLRDRVFSGTHTCSCKWPIWKRGRTVQDLSDLAQIHAGGVCLADPQVEDD
ncbi:hypothetical protein BDP27DRAFT_1425749 [Rhodocollybia butyracea]|uniref:Carrier domain-containing protein n=1 Tax=Rhodocollybia butyracea TaxID=206335 RepID=A0A9P5U3G1_9AGAR|nr:hypothetical protein BDP27DRAFT_1425749 [Rhodocollybia butyracea]